MWLQGSVLGLISHNDKRGKEKKNEWPIDTFNEQWINTISLLIYILLSASILN
jgi:hypothetical protein